jgi:phage shock protein E
MRPTYAISVLLLATAPAFAQTLSDRQIEMEYRIGYEVTKIAYSPDDEYDSYVSLAEKVAPLREKRLISLADFNSRSAKPDVLILDARSERAFAAGHIKGAVNLPLPSFSKTSLRKIIGENSNREILIYCNNNFTDNRFPVVTKIPRTSLNISTFVNLHQYGYKNVYELGEEIKTSHKDLAWLSQDPALVTKIGPYQRRQRSN